MEYVIFFAAILAFILFIMVKGYLDDKKRRKFLIQRLYQNYGELPAEREYTYGEMQRISRYFSAHRDEDHQFHIDDITWNDLGMDELYARVNYTHSAAGEEYLYYLLRSPLLKEMEEEETEDTIQYFMEQADIRVRFQTAFCDMGKTGKFSIYDYLDNLNLLGKRSNLGHYLGDLCIAASIGLMFLSIQLGLLAFCIVLTRNVINYYKEKNQIEPYIISIAYILRFLKASDELCRLPCEKFEEERRLLKETSRIFSGFRKGASLVMSYNHATGASNPLEMIFEYVKMIFHLDLIKFNTMFLDVMRHKKEIDQMITVFGRMEALICIGSYRASLESYCVPEFMQTKQLKARELYHPLIHNPVKNSIMVKRGVLVTGSNASGKSTFLKTIAINAILAQSLKTALAQEYTACRFRICSSMSLRDDLAGGDSYYMVEIKALKRILDCLKEDGAPLLCFVDEVLRGTNTVERIAASTQILRSLNRSNSMSFAATHDIELTHLLEKEYENYHFEEDIIEGDVVFNYCLKKGRATTRNAIKLLSVMGYDEALIQKADELAASFMKYGKWETE